MLQAFRDGDDEAADSQHLVNTWSTPEKRVLAQHGLAACSRQTVTIGAVCVSGVLS